MFRGERHRQVGHDREAEQQTNHRQLARLARPMLPHKGYDLPEAGLVATAFRLIVDIVRVTHLNTGSKRNDRVGGTCAQLENGKRSAGSEASETRKHPQAQLSRGTVSPIAFEDFRTEAAEAPSRFDGDRSRRRAYLKRVFIRGISSLKAGLLTVTPALRKAKAARMSKT
jgi:hypothetical protein